MTRILLIDDDDQLCLALEAALGRHDFTVQVASTATEGLEQIAISTPDLVILDLGLPDTDGVDVVRRTRSWNHVPVLVLSGATDEKRRVEALDAGADDFLQKPFGVEELIARVRAVLRRVQGDEVEESAQAFRFGPLHVDLANRAVSRDGDEVRLTPKEWRLLELFVAHPGRLLTHRWLLGEVWDSNHGEETRAALRAHIRSLRAKIADDANQPMFLRTESGSGYRWIAVHEPEAPAVQTEDGGRGTAAGEPVDVMGTSAIVHELNNALTAIRVATFVLKTRVGAGGSEGTEDISARIDQIVMRVSGLAVELENRVMGIAVPTEALPKTD